MCRERGGERLVGYGCAMSIDLNVQRKLCIVFVLKVETLMGDGCYILY